MEQPFDTALPLVKTNFTKSEITSLLMDAPGFTNSEIEQMTIPAEGTYGSKKLLMGAAFWIWTGKPIFKS